jgi:alpha-galactosidase
MNILSTVAIFLILATFVGTAHAQDSADPKFYDWAKTPPLGWNSWDCYGTSVTEEQTLANADYMAENLKSHGWQYITVDIQWYEPNAHKHTYRRDARLEMDDYGRLLPASNRFPSTDQSRSFKPLADAIHARGLKFGLHLLRGIPRQAVHDNTPILNTSYHAADIADTNDICQWSPDMYGVDMTKPGAQEYYDSVFQLLASWEIDLIKVDDLSRPYHTAEIEAIRKAIDKTGRPIVFSTSPGATPLADGEHIANHANMWRISDDFWDDWKLLKEQFERLGAWTPHRAPGHFPDADMLPLGNVRAFESNGWTHLTHNEQITLMTLWSIAKSPLIMGGNLPKNDEFTLSLLTNDSVLAVDQNSTGNHQLFRDGDLICWIADVPNSHDKYVALFNAKDHPATNDSKTEKVTVTLKDLGFQLANVHDLWSGEYLGNVTGSFSADIPYHGAGLYRLSPI